MSGLSSQRAWLDDPCLGALWLVASVHIPHFTFQDRQRQHDLLTGSGQASLSTRVAVSPSRTPSVVLVPRILGNLPP